MTKAWRVVLWLVMAVLVIGIVLMGAGWLTGASPARMAELVFGGVDEARAAADAAISRAAGIWTAVSMLFR